MPRWCLCPDRRLVGMYVPKTEAAGTQRKPRQLAVSVARDRIKNFSFLFMWNAKIVLWQGIITLPNDEGFLLLSLKEKTTGDFVVIFLIQMASFDFSYRRISFYSKKIDDSICVSCSDRGKLGGNSRLPFLALDFVLFWCWIFFMLVISNRTWCFTPWYW
jgi:hypothetical protein